SSRRRHTRCLSDWSSDVCSSDLVMHALAVAREEAAPSVRKHGLVGAGAPVFRIYASDQAHSSAEKAAIALGLGEENVQRVSTDRSEERRVGKECGGGWERGDGER